MAECAENHKKRRVVIVTGLSGAGKTGALKAFEDIGFHVVDNLPLTMIINLLDETLEEEGRPVPLAIGLDSRTLAFTPESFASVKSEIIQRPDVSLHVLFMDAATNVLTSRFSETRRRHPLARKQQLAQAIKQERKMMQDIRPHVDGLVDTSKRSPTETKRIIMDRFTDDISTRLIVTCMSFAYAKGVPRDADLVFDVRFLRNPHYDDTLRPMNGRDKRVANYVRADEGFNDFVGKLESLLQYLLPRYMDEGKSYLTIAFGCTGGKHRSVMMAETMASLLTVDGLAVNLYHREI